jgi:hypothetical protein
MTCSGESLTVASAHFRIFASITTSQNDTMKLQGAFTALVTPFTEDGSAVDYEKLRELVEWQIQEGIDGLVPVSDNPIFIVEPNAPLTRAYCAVDGYDWREPHGFPRGA